MVKEPQARIMFRRNEHIDYKSVGGDVWICGLQYIYRTFYHATPFREGLKCKGRKDGRDNDIVTRTQTTRTTPGIYTFTRFCNVA
jgi:hypothetical protein